MVFIKKTKESIELSTDEKSESEENESEEIENGDENVIKLGWNKITTVFNQKFGSKKTLSSFKSLYNKRLKYQSVKKIKKFPPSRIDQLTTRQMIYLKKIKENIIRSIPTIRYNQADRRRWINEGRPYVRIIDRSHRHTQIKVRTRKKD